MSCMAVSIHVRWGHPMGLGWPGMECAKSSNPQCTNAEVLDPGLKVCIGVLLCTPSIQDPGLQHQVIHRRSSRQGGPRPALGRVEGGGQPVLSCKQCFTLFQVFLSFLHLVLGPRLGPEFRVGYL